MSKRAKQTEILSCGWSLEKVAEEFGVTHAQIVAALEWAAASLWAAARLSTGSTVTVIYLAAPAGAPTPEEHMENLARAKRWFAWAARHGVAVVADWILYCEVWSDFDTRLRAVGLEHDDATIRRCDEYWMVGGRVSAGMARGQRTAVAASITVRDMTAMGAEPPEAG